MTTQPAPTSPDANTVVADTQRWLERAVIGLNLCPFAKSVVVKQQVRYVVCDTDSEADLNEQLESELLHLAQADPSVLDTTLLMLPNPAAPWADFYSFHAYCQGLPRLLKRLRLAGGLQIANFHPRFEFAGVDPADVTNLTNRAPYPTLHLLREASIARAVDAFPNPESIYGTNMQRLRELGHDGWAAMGLVGADVSKVDHKAGGSTPD